MSHRAITLHDDDLLVQVAPTREALHAGVTRLYELARDRLGMRDPTVIDNDTGEIVERRYRLMFGEDRDSRSLRQNRFYFGPVLRQIAEQAPGHYTTQAWHEAFKRQFLGFEITSVEVAGRKRKTTIRRLRSTTGLSVKQMSEYLDEVIATAANDLGVVFDLDPTEREAVRWKAKKRKPAVQREEVAA